MNRRRLRWALLAVIVIALSTVFYQVRSSVRSQKEKEVDESPLGGMLPQAVQWIQKFHRIEIKDGRKVWEVKADEAQYLQERAEVVVRAPQAVFFPEEGEKVTVSGDHGRLHFDGKDLQAVVLRDNVEIHVRGFVIHTAGARYDRTTDRVTADGPVSIVGELITLTGTDMIVYMKDARFELQQGVRVTLFSKDSKVERRS